MPNRRFAIALSSALADLGVQHACVSPGSRNAPLLAGLAAESRIAKWTILDERSAGFFALGLARATGRPVVLACTSGTAAVEYHPAVVEAGLDDVPLLVLTADRPEELRGLGAPQTIDQISLYGTAVRMFADALAPDSTTPPDTAGAIAIDIWAHATASPPGPVHLNLPFREPLLTAAVGDPPPPVALPAVDDEDAPDLSAVAARLTGRRGLIIAGRSNDSQFPAACADLAAATGFPIIADPLSGLRCGPHSHDHVLGYADQLAAAGALERLAPEVVLRFGPVPTSKPVWSWLERNPNVDQILIDTQSRDATRSATTTLEVDSSEAARALCSAVTAPAPAGWLASWNDLDKVAATALGDFPFPSEPAVAKLIVDSVPSGAAITLGSSMPIRDVDAYSGTTPRALRLFGNRGANGIDGIVSSALGVAAAGINSYVLVGDVSLFHDLNSLGTAVQLDLPITVVVVNNNGGGIFHFLGHSDPDILDPETFETYLGTPHSTDFMTVAAALGLEVHDVTNADEFVSLLTTRASGPRLLHVRTDRRANLELHRAISRRVADLIR